MLLDAAGFSKDQSGFKSIQATPTLQGELVTASALLSQAIDRLAADDLGAGNPIYPFVKVTNAAAFNPVTSATFQVWGDDGVANNGGPSQTYGGLVNPVKLSDSGAIAVANLGAGTLIPMPPITPGNRKRYYYLYVVVTGGNASTGAIVAGLVDADARAQLFVQPSGTPTGHSL